MTVQLTARELEVLTLIANGFTHEEIGEQLFTSRQAVNDALTRARFRLGALSTPHAILLGVRAGILEGRPRRRPGPARQPLTARQAEVLAAAADGASIATVARRLDTTTQQVSARLSEGYRRLGVTELPKQHRRAAAVDVARRRGLIPPANARKDAA
ncbi:LuxR C-terminal-related transcriptional regulator [Streptomyces sp. KL116D]|uniref:LuxR C-terminal-related transcriptional regulator n=1 Tax=Streptomyces sp. KL116D TaxID=3045152 RepID=UPI0035576F75